ncbi:hypothetical protein MNBD_GAMMA22-806 [hydrothermal vent metagenome]|uniref:Lipopolysaccharide assembly protein A domain-containing protein n=1 Tax=hydrothermal vent metagenome TaxID=652676 RepID=A0A3B0ZPN2_9ZZZZ
MKNIFYFIFLIIVLTFGLIFTFYNSKNVSFNYVIGSIDLPLSLIITITVIVGATLGLLASAAIIIRARNELAQLKKSLKKLNN